MEQDPRGPFGWLMHFLKVELAPFPGRLNPVLRTLVSCALVIFISMSLQVPFLALSLIIVFFLTQANAAVTRMVAMLFIISIPVSIAIGIVLLKYTFGYPLLRIVAASVIFCICMFLMRVSRFNLAFFGAGLIIIYVQSLVDLVPDPEQLLRTNLWVGIATFYSAIVTLLVNTLFLPIEPRVQLHGLLQMQLRRVQLRLKALEDPAQPDMPISAEDVQKGVLGLHKLLKFAGMRDVYYREHEAYYLTCITCVSRLYAAAAALPLRLEGMDEEQRKAVASIRLECATAALAISKGTRFESGIALLHDRNHPLLEEMRSALGVLAATENLRNKSPKVAKEPFMATDALKNPAYLKFVLKAYLATVLCYVFYTGVAWPGIHTIMLTCVITSLPNLGASTQKGLLRISGCLIGAVLSVVAMVFVIPHIETIVDLLFMSLSVIALSAWVAAGSERSAYAGTQIMFCFALALLEDFGPVYDLTLVRDRLIGIVLGVAVSTVVQLYLWPEAEGKSLRQKMADLLHSIAQLLRSNPPPKPKASTAPLSTLSSWNQLANCEAMLTRVQLEPAAKRDEQTRLVASSRKLLIECKALLLAANALESSMTVLDADRTPDPTHPLVIFQNALAQYLDQYASQWTPVPTFAPDVANLSWQDIESLSSEARTHPANEGVRHVLRDLQQVSLCIKTLPEVTAH
jgi:multidrug resistance protein MdtO